MIKELFKEKTKMFLTIFAVAWGTFSIAIMLAIGEGLRTNVTKTLIDSTTPMISVTANRTSTNFLGIPANRPIYLDENDARAIKTLQNVKTVLPQYGTDKRLRYGVKSIKRPIVAVVSSYQKLNKLEVEPGGRFISQLDIDKGSNVIVLGSMTKRILLKNETNPIGKKISVSGRDFIIIGLIKDKSQLVARESPAEFNNWIPITTYEKMFRPHYYDVIYVEYKSTSGLPLLKSQIQQIIALNHGFSPTDYDALSFSDFSKQQDKINTFFFGLQVFLGIIGGLTLIIAGVGVANIMYATVCQSTREIGIKMAVGAKRRQIVFYYLNQALVTTLIGGFFGCLMTYLLCFGISRIPMTGEIFKHIGKIQPILSVSVLVIVIISLCVIGMLAGIFPALKAANTDPTIALTDE